MAQHPIFDEITEPSRSATSTGETATSPDWRRPGPVRAYVAVLVSVGIALAVAETLAHFNVLPDVSLLFLLSVLVPAIRFGIWPAVFASALAFLTYNFFFIDPLYTLTVARPRELLSLTAFLIIAVITAAIAGQSRERARMASEHAMMMRRLYEFTGKMSSIGPRISVVEAAAAEVRSIMGRNAILLVEQGGALEVAAAWPPEDQLDEISMGAARWSYACRDATGPGTGIYVESAWFFLPLPIGRRLVGVIGVDASGDRPPLDQDDKALLASLAEQLAIAIDRANLAKAIDAARSAAETERVRNLLLASVSHDFRTPLASILGAATSLSDYHDRFSEAQRADLLASIREEAEHLDTMVRNLLAITRLEAGALELSMDWVDIGEMLDRVVVLNRRRGARQTLRVDTPAGRLFVRADASLLEQAVGNIVANAILHCPAGASVALFASSQGDRVAISIEDDGPGINAELLPRIFDKFVRGRKPSGDGGEGSGLGLAITRGIVEAHGGKVSAESPIAHGHGSRFTLTLPLDNGSDNATESARG